MKDIEKLISPFIESQFPSVYREDGPQLVAFVKAYYEWLENGGSYYNYANDLVTPYIAANNNVLELAASDLANADYLTSLTALGYQPVGPGIAYHTRRLGEYRDIDTTIDSFVVQFKEKYLKNIQFDTATNKRLLVKNALNLYRSKGTERSIDLFFKLVYGTSAEIKYPGENVLRLSDGIWERPEYLEITYNEFNIDYLGKQIIGALSGAKAFVEKYIRRRVGRGYVNLLYISGVEGAFRNGEVIGINVDNVPDYTKSKRAQLIGSVDRVTIIDKGQGFAVGDTVSFQDSSRGLGGLARVASVSVATGLIDFIFVDGGWGYTLDATSLISEKVLSLGTMTADVDSDQYFRLFEQLVEPSINIAFTSATSNLASGNYVYRYAANGQLSGTGIIMDTEQVGTNGQITISHVNGVISNNVTYYTVGNAQSFFANTFEDRTIGGKVMGIPEVYTIQLTNQNGTIQVGQNVIQKNTTTVFARGTVNSIIQTATGNVVVLINARGAFKNSVTLETATYIAGTGTITANTANNIVVGSGTTFDNNAIGAVLYQATGNVALGTVESITNATSIVLSTNAAANVSANVFNYGPQYPIFVSGNTSITADVDTVSATVGVYEIKKFVNTIRYQSANNNELLHSNTIYQYNTSGNVISEGVLLTVNHNSGTSTGNLTFIPTKGSFKETDTFYTKSNTGSAIVVTSTTSNSGGDYINSSYAKLIAPTSNTQTDLTAISFGSGAQFGVGSIGDSEVIFIGTDLIGSNNDSTLDRDRKILTVASNTGFGVGSYVYQTVNKIAFNANSSVNAATGFISLPTANTLFTVGDNIRYEVDAGNTALNGMIAGDYYHVRFANTTGLILSYPYRKTDYINTSNFSAFANNKVNETGHYLYKQVYGTVFESSTGVVKIKDPVKSFGNTGGTANTTASANSNLIKYGTPTTNTDLQNITAHTTLTQANVPFISVPIRAAAYGFPINRQGDLADVIFSCLKFGRFEIGTIGSLSEVDPGSEYNTEPYVLTYQPYISAFDRHDFVITVNNATGVFLTGERVNQTLANLVYYDLKVNSGAYSNTYDEILVSVDTKNEVNGTSEFIFSPSNTITFIANSSGVGNTVANFISITGNPFSSNDYVRYYTDTGNTVISGLSNNAFYYIGYSNSTGVTLSATAGGANLALTAGGNESGHSIKNYVNNFANNQRIIYRTPTSNTVISGLANNTAYYIVSANSVGFKLSSTQGGSAIDLTAAGASETHQISTIPGYLPGDRVYQNTTPVMNASVQSIFSNTTGDYVRVSGNTANIVVTASNTLFSYTNPYVNAAVSNVSLFQIVSTAKGIIKAGSNSSVLFVKRLTFENTFQPGSVIIGDVSGTNADLLGVSQDLDELYPIGLNAVIDANVASSNGQVTSLDVFDSGFGYTNSEIVQFVSEDNLRAGSAKIIIDGAGRGKGYYRSSRGFLSEDMYIHDGDYYQEYSYEILSKISVDRYADMFKKVMHMAGTKFFGSALVIEEDSVAMALSEIATSQEVKFNSAADVNGTFETIEMDIEARSYEFNALNNVNQATEFFTLTNLPNYNPVTLANGDLVQYTSNTGNYIGVGDGSTTMSNAGFYYVVFANTSGVKLSTTLGGSVLNVNTAAMASEKHVLRQYINPFANNDTVRYVTTNTAVQANVSLTFVTNTISSNTISVNTNIFRAGDVVKYTKNGGSAAVGLTEGAEYFIRSANSTAIKLANSSGKLTAVYSNATVETHILRIEKLANNQSYYVVNTTPNTVKLSLTANGSPINITANTTTSGSNTAGHYLTKTVEE
jgi:hypothetical protein